MNIASLLAIGLLWSWIIIQERDVFRDQNNVTVAHALAFWAWLMGSGVAMCSSTSSTPYRKMTLVCFVLGGLMSLATCIVPRMLHLAIFGFHN
jgi:hypothetical protein